MQIFGFVRFHLFALLPPIYFFRGSSAVQKCSFNRLPDYNLVHAQRNYSYLAQGHPKIAHIHLSEIIDVTTPHSPGTVRINLQLPFASSKLDRSSFRLDGWHCIRMVGVFCACKQTVGRKVPGQRRHRQPEISIIFCFISQSNSIAAERGLSGVAMKPARLYPPIGLV